MPDRPPIAPRVAQPPGKTFLRFSPDGQRMLVAGCANYARSFKTNDDGEPDMIDHVHDDTLAVACGNDYAILGAEDGSVCEYAVADGHNNNLKEVLVRFTLPVRALALSPDEEFIAASSDEIEVKVVNRHDIERIHVLRSQPKPIKHLSYDPTGKWLAASCTDGKIYMYNVEEEEPKFVKAIDGIIQRLEIVDDTTSACFWHPQGKVFACGTASREVIIVSAEDGKIIRRFAGLHNSPVTSISWSPNARLLATSAIEGSLIVWDTVTGQVLQQNTYEKILHVEWHNKGENLFCWTNSWGEVYITPGFLKNPAHVELLKGAQEQPLPEAQQKPPQNTVPIKNGLNGVKPVRPLVNGRPRAHSPDSLDEYLADADDDQWIVDDDGAGYTNENGKRTNGHLQGANGHIEKKTRHETWQPQIHESFQPGATPWRGDRKYLCLNLTGFVWTVNHDTHNTVTVEFYDRETHRDFHFTDPFQYDKACLNEHGTLFSAPPNPAEQQPAIIFYRPHETWTNRADFRVSLPDGEDISCIALSSRYVIACTSKNYVRVWTLFGTPVRMWRMKSSPAVTCAAHNDLLITVTNGAVNSDGTTQLIYSIDNIRYDEAHQNSDLVALGTPHPDSDNYEDESVTLKSLFWTDTGDPAIYDSTGTLLVLVHWRNMGQAKWVPILDTRLLERLQGGKKEETYWPVAVADQKFHCIILKGGDKYPYFPRPLLSEFNLSIPISRPSPKKKTSIDDDGNEIDMDGTEETTAHQITRLEEAYVRSTLMMSLLDDFVTSHGEHARHTDKTELTRREIEVDKVLLQLLASECREGEDRGMKALEIVRMMRDRGGKMIEAASKVAGRWGRTVLEEKIREMGERRLAGVEEDE
ncbi:DNA polymerase alpha accessory factor Mcl1 [Lithohypha guttulata]|uniref:DNA polymerase alpha accessory factor Mcl1 n=1 Tax=Lithohypha guttulata TaxID=1690604 RepID=UPI002DDE840A|nr:DNA polymerase alpha accessory factor Mcl1 [Lithohypha guttulata]